MDSLAQQSAVNDNATRAFGLSNDEVQKVRQDFAKKCLQERCKAREEPKRLVCQGTGGHWFLNLLACCGA